MSAALPDDLDRFVSQELASGRYRSPDEVVCEGLRLLRDRQQRLHELRRDVRAGLAEIEQGLCTPYDEQALDRFVADIRAAEASRFADEGPPA